ncbi:MAG: GNAT family N-acetyltransferase [Bacillota bacterium]
MKWKIKKINEINSNKLYEILKARVDVFVVEQECPYPELDGKDKNSFHLWAEEEGEIIAYSRILPPGVSYEETSIGRVLVKIDYRGNGIGRKLMNKTLDYILNEMGKTEIRISAQERLVDFYESLGFEQVSEMYLEDDIPHVEMYFQK